MTQSFVSVLLHVHRNLSRTSVTDCAHQPTREDEAVTQRRVRVHCCFTSRETFCTIRDGEPRTAASTVTHLLSSDTDTKFRFSVALRPQKPLGLLGTGSPGRPPRLSHSPRALGFLRNTWSFTNECNNKLRHAAILIFTLLSGTFFAWKLPPHDSRDRLSSFRSRCCDRVLHAHQLLTSLKALYHVREASHRDGEIGGLQGKWCLCVEKCCGIWM